ncbi:sur7 protein [Ophiocordyceps camponoti-floridani]|uniref:Sur7 protein n=1 Tax=Ophiocordyceps camponoti-floridani TaxID=2030778 RepID=A0A8H4QAK5_9HYPO|nr:sur7 protein [Ophiocordyceps camponoti-floridani]
MSESILSEEQPAQGRFRSLRKRFAALLPFTSTDDRSMTDNVHRGGVPDKVVMILQSRPAVFLNLLVTFIAFILVILALAAGNSKGFMEDHSIIRFDTSALGGNLLSTGLEAVDLNATMLGQQVIGALAGRGTSTTTNNNNNNNNNNLGSNTLAALGNIVTGRSANDNKVSPRGLLDGVVGGVGNVVGGVLGGGPGAGGNPEGNPAVAARRRTPGVPVPVGGGIGQLPPIAGGVGGVGAPLGAAIGGAIGGGLANGGLANALAGLTTPVVNRAFGAMQTAFDNLKTSVQSGPTSAVIAKQVTTNLGITDWYSLHVNGICQGVFDADRRPVATNCTSSPARQLDSAATGLTTPLDLGPVTLNLANTGLPTALNQYVGYINAFLLVIFLQYVFGVIFSTFLLLFTVIFLIRAKTFKLLLLNTVLASTALSFVLVGTILTTVAAVITSESLKNIGPTTLGLTVQVGHRFLLLTWFATVSLSLPATYWTVQLILCGLGKKRDKKSRELRDFVREKHGEHVGEDSHMEVHHTEETIGVAKSEDL